MPFIDVKLSKKITQEEKESLKSQFGKAIALMRKPESYLMVGIADGYDLYFGGKAVENGAFVAVSVLGQVNSAQSEQMTKEVCRILGSVAGCDASKVYVSYQGIADWGWNGGNF